MTRILVVDDEKPVIEGISHIVRRDLAREFEVVGSASSGRVAIEKAAVLSPDLVLMDVRMPGISGMDAIREMRKRGSTAYVILITAYERFDIARDRDIRFVNLNAAIGRPRDFIKRCREPASC